MLVHVRPNGAYLVVMALAIAGVGLGVAGMLQGGSTDGALGALAVAGCGVLVVLLGFPIVVSTVFRVPALAVDEQGVRLPLMGVRLAWEDISSVTVLSEVRGRPRPTVLIVPTAPDTVIRQARPWLRREARAKLARHGTPLVVPAASLNRSADDIGAAIGQYHR